MGTDLRHRRTSCAVLLGAALALALGVVGAACAQPVPSASEIAQYRRTAQQLYNATSDDAVTFGKALTDPAVRQQVEKVFKRKLTDEQLRSMASQADAEANYWRHYLIGLDQKEAQLIPGRLPPLRPPEPLSNPGAVPAPQPYLPNVSVPIPDRWRILEALGRTENPFDPYNTNTLKADKPIFGTNNWFFELDAIADSRIEPSRVPIPTAAQSSTRPGENNTFGRYGRLLFNETDILSLSLIEGDTAYKPQDLEIRFTPVVNYNHTDVGEQGVININPQKGTVRDDAFVGIQEAFVDKHLRNVSEYYDFDSLRIGIQPFNADFRGFVFQDNELGVRLFGDRDANRWQYNLAYFRLIEKDTNSGLNDLGQSLRKNDVFIANLYRQDFPVHGFTSQIVYIRNNDNEDDVIHYDKNGFLVLPAQIGDNRGYSYDVNYLGLNGDGHFGRLNLTASAYWLFGHQSHNQFGTDPQNRGGNVNALFLAAEPSIDFDYLRVRGSLVFQSGDGDPKNGHLTGFDSIFENPQIAGSDTSYFIRQGIPFIGGGIVGVNQPNGILADLRASKLEGQSNFVNPGLFLAGIGTDIDILPELRLTTNFNYLRFADTHSLQLLRNQGSVPHEIGYDLSVSLIYRPLDTQNIVFRASGAVLLPGDGLKAIYKTSDGLFSSGHFLYSALFDMILTY